jgi:hypothetical protein
MRPLFQQGLYPVDVLLQHTTGPEGGGHANNVHPVGQAAVVLAVALEVVVVVVVVVVTGAVCFAVDFLVDGATATSPAQAGATRIKANMHSSILFMFISQKM